MWLCPTCRQPAGAPDSAIPWGDGWSCTRCGTGVPQSDGIPCLAPGLIDTTEGFDPAFFEELVRYEDTNFWFVNRADLIAHVPAGRRDRFGALGLELRGFVLGVAVREGQIDFRVKRALAGARWLRRLHLYRAGGGPDSRLVVRAAQPHTHF